MTMVPSDLKRVTLRTGLSLAAALMLSAAAFAQDATTGNEVELNAVDPVVEITPIFAVDPLPAEFEVQSHDLDPIDDETIAIDEPDFTVDGTDEAIAIDEPELDVDGTDESTMVIDALEGGLIDCVECLYETVGLPGVELEMSGVGPVVLDQVKRSTKSKASISVQMYSVSDAAACLMQYPQLPWICEWQNGTRQ